MGEEFEDNEILILSELEGNSPYRYSSSQGNLSRKTSERSMIFSSLTIQKSSLHTSRVLEKKSNYKPPFGPLSVNDHMVGRPSFLLRSVFITKLKNCLPAMLYDMVDKRSFSGVTQCNKEFIQLSN